MYLKASTASRIASRVCLVLSLLLLMTTSGSQPFSCNICAVCTATCNIVKQLLAATFCTRCFGLLMIQVCGGPTLLVLTRSPPIPNVLFDTAKALLISGQPLCLLLGNSHGIKAHMGCIRYAYNKGCMPTCLSRARVNAMMV